MTSEGTVPEVPKTYPRADFEESLNALRSQPIASDVDGLRNEIAAFKETYPVDDYDTFVDPFGRPFKVPVMMDFNRVKRSSVYKALEMLAVRNQALALMLEKKRVADAVAKHASEHGLEEFDCPICLDTVIKISDDSIEYFLCCGNGICATCDEEMTAKGKFEEDSTCPLCRAPMPTDDEAVVLTERLASRGIAWGQLERGKDLLFEGKADEPLSNNPNGEEGLRLIHLAADQGEAPALHLLFKIHEGGHFGQEQSETLAFEYLKRAADRGCLSSQSKLAVNPPEAITSEETLHYATLAFSDMHKIRSDWDKLSAAYMLGVAFYHGKYIEGGFDEGSPDRNLYLAKYYLEIAAGSQVQDPERKNERINIYKAYELLGYTLLDLFEKDYRLNDMTCFQAHLRQQPAFGTWTYDVDLEPGYSAVPLAMYWLKKEPKHNMKPGTERFIAQLDEKFKHSCANCGKRKKDIEKDLSKCSRCHVSYYCSKDCQAMHWKNGHKKDCVPKNWLYVDVMKMVKKLKVLPDGSHVLVPVTRADLAD